MQSQPQGAENTEQLLRSANGITEAVQLITVNGKYNGWRDAHVAAITPAVLAPTDIRSELSCFCPHIAAPHTGHSPSTCTDTSMLCPRTLTFLSAFS